MDSSTAVMQLFEAHPHEEVPSLHPEISPSMPATHLPTHDPGKAEAGGGLQFQDPAGGYCPYFSVSSSLFLSLIE